MTIARDEDPVEGHQTRLPIVVLYAFAALYGVVIGLRLPWVGDLGLHIAVVRQLRDHLVDPVDPLVGGPVASPYYSPYTVLQALLARGLGISAFTITHVAAIGNALLLASGTHHFVRRLSPRPWAPLTAFAALMLLQGTSVFVWSGFYGLLSFAVTLAYPSVFALGITLHLWGFVVRALRRPAPWWLFLVIAVLGADVLLDHQFTAIGAGLGCLSLLISYLRRLHLRQLPTRLLCWVGTAAAALLLVLAWPYYWLPHVAAGAGGLDAIQQPLYQSVPGRFGLALLFGVPALAVRFRRDRLDPLVLLFVMCGLLVGYGWISGHYTWGRVWPMALLAGQLAFGIEIAVPIRGLLRTRREAGRPRAPGDGTSPRRSRPAARLTLMAVTGLAFLVGLWTQGWTLEYALPGELPHALTDHLQARPVWHSYAAVARHIPTGQVVVTDDYHAERMLPAYGVFTVAPAYPEPWLASETARDQASAALLAPTTAASQRLGLVRRYRVRWLVGDAGQVRALRSAGLTVAAITPAPYGVWLYRVDGVAAHG